MSIEKSKKIAIQHHLSGIEKLKDGAKDWITCGNALADIKMSKRGTFIEFVEKEMPFSKRQAQRYIRFAAHGPLLLELIQEHGSLSQNEALKMLPAASQSDLAYVGSINEEKTPAARNSDNWHTPDGVIEAAKHVMGGIDLDPFSSAEANSRIEAKDFYTVEDNALERDWSEKKAESIFVNPPYGRGLISKAVEKVIEQHQTGAFKECILLVNNATDTQWFHRIAPLAKAICLTKGRISFLSPQEDGVLKQVSSNTRGQVLFYIGQKTESFIETFKDLGWCMEVNKC